MFDILGMLGLALFAAFFGWLGNRARRATRPLLKWGGMVVSGLLTLVLTTTFLVASVGFYRLTIPPHQYSVTEVKVAGTPEQVARGERFAAMCPLCHSPDGKPPLVGQDFGTGGPPIGTLYAANLTPAGEINEWSDGEVIRAIRGGIHKSGRALLIMPSEVFRHFSDEDVQAIVAYLRSQPPAGSRSPATKPSVVAALFVGSGLFPTSAQTPITQPVVAPAEGPSAEYGEYLISILGCRLCHGENLAGRPTDSQGPPAGPNLTLVLPRWTEQQFIQTLRTGVNPYGRKINGELMPWKQVSAFARDQDLQAIYAYVHQLKPLESPK
jgi:mono/diheme cytochrome c family protein